LAYHTLFYAHFYLQQNQEAFTPWVRHREEAQFISQMPMLEHQLVNIRHIQHHAAARASRLRRSAGIGVTWVGKGWSLRPHAVAIIRNQAG
jgi:hypothetical protein